MTFLSPERLWLGVAVIALLLAYLYVQGRRRRYAVRFASFALLARVAPKPGFKRHFAPILFLLMMSTLVVGFAQPQRETRVPQEQATVILAFDLSGSMEATDIKPNRFAVAQAAAVDFVRNLPEGYRVGLITFADTARLAADPTRDHDKIVQALGTMDPNGGTAMGDAIQLSVAAAQRTDEAAKASQERIPTRVVLLSDGKNSQGSSPDEGIRAAVTANVPISTIAYGTDNGMLGTVAVPADNATLAKVAGETGGQAYQATKADELREVYDQLGSSISYRNEKREISSWFIGGAFGLALIAAGLSLRLTGRLP